MEKGPCAGEGSNPRRVGVRPWSLTTGSVHCSCQKCGAVAFGLDPRVSESERSVQTLNLTDDGADGRRRAITRDGDARSEEEGGPEAGRLTEVLGVVGGARGGTTTTGRRRRRARGQRRSTAFLGSERGVWLSSGLDVFSEPVDETPMIPFP